MSAHVHAHLMELYALDAQETDKPWERWQIKSKYHEDWVNARHAISFSAENEYRRRRYMLVDTPEYQVPMPLTWQDLTKLTNTQNDEFSVFLPSIVNGSPRAEALILTAKRINECYSNSCTIGDHFLELGIHANDEDALAHAKWILSRNAKAIKDLQ